MSLRSIVFASATALSIISVTSAAAAATNQPVGNIAGAGVAQYGPVGLVTGSKVSLVLPTVAGATGQRSGYIGATSISWPQSNGIITAGWRVYTSAAGSTTVVPQYYINDGRGEVLINGVRVPLGARVSTTISLGYQASRVVAVTFSWSQIVRGSERQLASQRVSVSDSVFTGSGQPQWEIRRFVIGNQFVALPGDATWRLFGSYRTKGSTVDNPVATGSQVQPYNLTSFGQDSGPTCSSPDNLAVTRTGTVATDPSDADFVVVAC